MCKNKKGFTLIEVLSILVILSLTIIVGFNTIIRSLNNTKERAYNEQISRIIKVSKNWHIDNNSKVILLENETYYLSMDELKENKIIDDIPIDPRNNKKMNGCVKIFHSEINSNYQYDYIDNENCPNHDDLYNITYVLDGGTLTESNPLSYKVSTPTFNLNNPTKADYKFSGWSLNNSNEINIIETLYKGSKGDRLYTAHWNRELHVQVDPDGGEYFGETDFYIAPNSKFNLGNLNRKGYNLIEWTASSSDVTINGSSVQLGETSVKITASWNIIPYTLTYNLNGGVAINLANYFITSPTFTLNNPTREGYKFIGWTGSNGDIPSTSVTIEKGSTGNKEYTAHWEVSDNTPPDCDVEVTVDNSTSGVSFTWLCTDDSGIDGISTDTITDRTSNWNITVKDIVGNSTPITVNVSNKTQYRKRSCTTCSVGYGAWVDQGRFCQGESIPANTDQVMTTNCVKQTSGASCSNGYVCNSLYRDKYTDCTNCTKWGSYSEWTDIQPSASCTSSSCTQLETQTIYYVNELDM